MAKEAVVRPGRPEDLEAVFLMGYDPWGRGLSVDDYLAECRASDKYPRGRWWVVEVEGRVVCALIVYRGLFGLPEGAYGIGSLCTEPAVRRLGLAKALMRVVLAREPGTAYLWADAVPDFYERLGFTPLPPEAQTRPGSVLMARGERRGEAGPLEYF